MKTLTLEYLAPYLPYGIKCLTYNNQIEYISLEPMPDPDYICVSDFLKNTNFKLILRPLSDLDKPLIGINEPNFKPSSRYDLRFYDGEWCEEYYAEYGETPIAYIPVGGYNSWPFKYHFDVFGLISQGLAVDINTLTP